MPTNNGRCVRLLQGEAVDVETLVLEVPEIQVVFQHDGSAGRVEWRCADYAEEDDYTPDDQVSRGETTISIVVDEPEAVMTDIELSGLVFVDSGGSALRRIEPTRISNTLNLGNGFTTTESSVLTYRTYDKPGDYVGTTLTRCAASFKADSSLHLFFRYSDGQRNPGRISIFADADERAAASSGRLRSQSA